LLFYNDFCAASCKKKADLLMWARFSLLNIPDTCISK
jgi:hypothetical protein